LEDGTALLRAARVQRIDAAVPDFAWAFGMGKKFY
jgi:hypothetical protein